MKSLNQSKVCNLPKVKKVNFHYVNLSSFKSLNYWLIDFYFSWFGKWLRRWRGEVCRSADWDHVFDPLGLCEQRLEALREAQCINSEERLLDALKKLDCLSFNSSPRVIPSSTLAVILVLAVLISWSAD